MSVPRKIQFTRETIARLQPPERGQVDYSDARYPNLYLRVSSGGAKTWAFRARLDGRVRRKTLGSWPDLSPTEARERAEIERGRVRQGQNPFDAEKKRTGEPTLSELWALYLKIHAKVRKRTWVQDQRLYDRHLKPRWSAHRISSIGRRDVLEMHREIGADHPTQANRVLALLRKMLNFAIDELEWAKPNPCARIEPFEETKRTRWLTGDEMARFFAALAADSDEAARDAIQLLLLTGQRKMNVLSMRFSDVDLSAGVWKIPAERFKGRREHFVPLDARSLAVLERRREAVKGDYVFPGRRRATPHRTEIRNALDRVLAAAKLEDVTLHILRHTWATWALGSGQQLYHIQKALGHASSATTQRYAHLDLADVRRSMETTTAAMFTAVEEAAEKAKRRRPVPSLPAVDAPEVAEAAPRGAQ